MLASIHSHYCRRWRGAFSEVKMFVDEFIALLRRATPDQVKKAAGLIRRRGPSEHQQAARDSSEQAEEPPRIPDRMN